MITSFGYKHGPAPKRADKVFDVRDLTHDTNSPEFKDKQREIVEYGRAHGGESIAVGCEKGQHRSVVLASKAASALRQSLYLRDKAK